MLEHALIVLRELRQVTCKHCGFSVTVGPRPTACTQAHVTARFGVDG